MYAKDLDLINKLLKNEQLGDWADIEYFEDLLVNMMLIDEQMLQYINVDSRLIDKYIEHGGSEEVIDRHLEQMSLDVEAILKRAGGEVEQEIEGEKVRITLNDEHRDMSLRQLMQEFGVSYTTAWRARKRGWFHQNYHERTITADERWNAEHVELLHRAVDGAFLDLAQQYSRPDIAKVQRYMEESDIKEEALLYLLQHTGTKSFHQQNESGQEARDSRSFLQTVALNFMNNLYLKFLARVGKESFSLDGRVPSKLDK